MERADICLLKLGLAKSRTHAKNIILEKRAFHDGKVIEKVSLLVDDNLVTVNSTVEDTYVGRGAIKLDSAIKNFELDLKDLVCMDIGASTGGFTQIMLNEKAKKVYAIDVGTNQLVDSLLNDERVVSLENTNFRYLDFEVIGEKVDFISIDVSFISLKYIFENLYKFLKEDSKIVALIKPQFECEGKSLNKKGIVKSKKVIENVVEKVKLYALANKLEVLEIIDSPILGGDGNKEKLALIKGIF
ncbi:ribosomal RNA large subunit methyltransferase J [Parvimonas sp. KA00067]|uniref:TlyA family RNA methyltransferase n=1 Tax=Parvimonas sp. KA00067 TaxID=1588755 RepID=UPI000798381B|nr:TlyA family RNA methyltransferase [Parvimonas sp. KA00067]KXB66690.1 ribosomal RNA large subunit methyltransferase J [Parvimonas sp. KA00067]